MQRALIVIDVQNDFCPGGALAVPGGDEIIEKINNRISNRALYDVVVLTQDWHPADHKSFAINHKGKNPFDMADLAYGPQVLWPAHCVQGTHGAEFHPALDVNGADAIFRKGFNRDIDSYSAFMENDKTTRTGLESYLLEKGVTECHFVGLATDFCVAYSAIDARPVFNSYVLQDMCRGINLNGSLDAALKNMHDRGVVLY